MPIKSSVDAQEAWLTIRKNAKNIKAICQGQNTLLAGGNVTVEQIFNGVYRALKNSKTQLDTLGATQGLNAYVITATGDPLYDAVSEVTDTSNAIQAAMTWINTNAEGLNLTGDTAENYLTNFSIASNRFSAAQTAGLRTLLNAVIASIDD